MLISVCPYLRTNYDQFSAKEMIFLYARYLLKYGIWDEKSGRNILYKGVPMFDLFEAINSEMKPLRVIDLLLHFCRE